MSGVQTRAHRDRPSSGRLRDALQLGLAGALLVGSVASLPMTASAAGAAQAPGSVGVSVSVLGLPAARDSCQLRSFTRAAAGHFDLGPTVRGSALVPAVKDDRAQPATWGQPGQFLFELGDSSRRRLPSGLEFIAPAGTPVHMIGATQQSGVPWLGWNTQHPSLLSQAASDVRMTLVSARGPGQVAVFTSGSFGQAVGQRVFDTVGGPRSATVPLNTHAHGNWVFTSPGAYQLQIAFTFRNRAGQNVTGSTWMQIAVGLKDPVRAFSGCAPAGEVPPAGVPAPPAQRQAPAQGQPAAAPRAQQPSHPVRQGAGSDPVPAPAVEFGTSPRARGQGAADRVPAPQSAAPAVAGTEGTQPAAPMAPDGSTARPGNALPPSADPLAPLDADTLTAPDGPTSTGQEQARLTAAASTPHDARRPFPDPASAALGAGSVLLLGAFGLLVYRLALGRRPRRR